MTRDEEIMTKKGERKMGNERRQMESERRKMEEGGLKQRSDEELRKKGAYHYETSGVEPIDLLRDGHMLRSFALGCIIKYAFRNRLAVRDRIDIGDMRKIRHYAEILEEWKDEV